MQTYVFKFIEFVSVILQLNFDVKPMAIHNVKADQIGKLVNICGIVPRATEVKPMLQGK